MNRLLRQSLVWLVFLALAASGSQASDLPDFAQLVRKYSPAVVKIQIEAGTKSGGTVYGWPPEQELPEPFKRFFQIPDSQDGTPRQGLGSGFIIESDGYVLTNYHVISGAERITVRLSDRREFHAEIVGSDARSDIALLKIAAKGLPTLHFAEDDELKVGEWVLAIGSPFGLDYSVAQGIVSAIGRSLPNEKNENYVPFIQTDVAINPGNSGGPLFNLDGDVVGINSQIYTRSGGSMGLSFAIPASVARNVVSQLKEHGTVSRGWLGVSIQEVDAELARSFGLSKPEGALVAQIVQGGPADTGGIRVGDIITQFNGRPILFSADLPHTVGQVRPGSKVKLVLMRNGKSENLELRVGELPDGNRESSRVVPQKSPDQAGYGALGLLVGSMDGAARTQLQISGGVVVKGVKPGSAAAKTGLQTGDVIVQLGFDNVDSVAEFQELAAQLPAGSIQPIRFFRNGNPVFRSIVIE